MKRKRIVSAMLLMIMIATTFNTNVFAGGNFSCVKVENVDCGGIFKNCCTSEQNDEPKTPLVEHITSDLDFIPPLPKEDDIADTSVKTSESKVVINSITPPTIIPTEVTKTDNSAQACVEVDKIDSFTQTCKKDITLQQIPESCKCGDNIRYTFNIQSGELIISGIGKMDNYSGWPDFSIAPPWESYKERITSIKIENGVTKIGKGAFCNCKNLVSVTIPDSVTKICSFAFSGCTGLLSVDIPESVDSIGDSAFYDCKSLKNITILGSLDFIDHHAFYGCTNLDYVIYYGNRQPEIGVYRLCSLYPVFVKCSNLNRIHVPFDYKEDKFCGIQVIKGKN